MQGGPPVNGALDNTLPAERQILRVPEQSAFEATYLLSARAKERGCQSQIYPQKGLKGIE